jgi:hypothetical protein
MEGRANPTALSLGLETFYLLVRRPVDLIELGASVIDELGDFVDDTGHRVVKVGLIHHGQRVPHVHLVHAVDQMATVVRIKPISRPADACRNIGIRLRLLAHGVSDIGPGVGRCRRPEAAKDCRRAGPGWHSGAGAYGYQLIPKSRQIDLGAP